MVKDMSRNYTANSVSVGPSNEFIETPAVKELITRALSYLEAGIPVHLSGPTGTGKSTLAMHLAYQLKQPVMLMFGDEEFGTSDLVGDSLGYRKRKLVDNFIHSVLKTEEEVSQHWVDNRLTTACKHGFTLVYDEFNRSRPEANNALLSVLEEGILTLPPSQEDAGYLKVHPNFRAIFTSNPYEYAGVHKTQDALLDRMVSLHVTYIDEATEQAIVAARSGLSLDESQVIVGIVRDFRQVVESSRAISIRPAINIGKIIKQQGLDARQLTPILVDLYLDALLSGSHHGAERTRLKDTLISLIHKHTCDDAINAGAIARLVDQTETRQSRRAGVR